MAAVIDRAEIVAETAAEADTVDTVRALYDAQVRKAANA
jgi:hypothetical protein